MTLALSTPVWRWVKYVVKFPFHPFETIDEDSSNDEADPKSTSAKKAKRQMRRFKKVKRKTNYHETDFWEVMEKKKDEYEIPAQNRQSASQPSEKGGTWRSHKSFSSDKRSKRLQGRAGNYDASQDLP